MSRDAITEFRSIPAGEVFPRVWLRVGFPPRGSILSLSILDHFYIEGGAKDIITFHPARPGALEQAVEHWEQLRQGAVAPQYVITLIHGTWAPHADWNQNLDRHSTRRWIVEFAAPKAMPRFAWSGRNSIYARPKCLTALRAHLQKLLDRYPTPSISSSPIAMAAISVVRFAR